MRKLNKHYYPDVATTADTRQGKARQGKAKGSNLDRKTQGARKTDLLGSTPPKAWNKLLGVVPVVLVEAVGLLVNRAGQGVSLQEYIVVVISLTLHVGSALVDLPDLVPHARGVEIVETQSLHHGFKASHHCTIGAVACEC